MADRWIVRARAVIVVGAVAVLASAALRMAAEDAPAVTVGAHETTAASTSDAQGLAGISVVPDSDLVDGQVVEVAGPFDPAAVVGVGLCDAQAVGDDRRLSWCDVNVAFATTGEGDEQRLAVTVVRVIQTAEGVIDCAGEHARCVIGIRTTEDLFAPVSYRLTPQLVTAIEVDNNSVDDGVVVHVTGSGWTPNSEVYVQQCRGDVNDDGLGSDRAYAQCDQARSTRVVADVDGRFDLSYRAFAEGVNYEGWFRCDPCVLSAGSFRQERAHASLAVSVRGDPIRPEVTLTPTGSLHASQRVTVHGSGFQALTNDLEVGWCQFVTTDHEQAREGEPAEGGTRCIYPEEGFTASTDHGGTFVIDDYPIPDEAFAGRCDGQRVQCALAWYPGEGSLPAFVTVLELI